METYSQALNWFSNTTTMMHIPKLGLGGVVEILLLTTIFYYLAKSLKGTRAWVLFKGITIILAFYVLAYVMSLSVIVSIFQSIILFLGIAIVVTIQPELRKLIERIGTKNINVSVMNVIHTIFRDKSKASEELDWFTDLTIQEIVKGCAIMGKAKTGALIVIERNIPLNDYIESGIKVNADITAELLINIFEKNTPLHDGAVIVQNNRVTAATCYLPLSESKRINKELGTRHRAGIGISEVTDAFVVIVSEETGAISVSKNGQLLLHLDREKLSEELKKIQRNRTNQAKQPEKKPSITIAERNLTLKLGCLLGTTILWFMVTMSINPVTSVTFNNVPIELINTNVITDTGKAYEVLSGERVNVTIRDRKDVIDSINEEDIEVIADFSKLSYVNSIILETTFNNNRISEVYLSKNTIEVSLEDVVTTEVSIETNLVGNGNDNYYISGIVLNTETLVISGAKSVINTIGKVEVNIDESKLTSDTVLKLAPIIYDKNGKELNSSRFTLNYNEIEASISLYKTKLVPLDITVVLDNKALAGIISGISYEESEVYITGSDELLAQYDELKLEVPLNINIEDISQSEFIRNIRLQDYLPDGLMVTPQFSKINLLVKFNDFTSRELNLNTRQITIEGLESDRNALILNQDIDISLVGEAKDINGKTIPDLVPYIDVDGLTDGTHEVALKFKYLNERVFNSPLVKVTISRKG